MLKQIEPNTLYRLSYVNEADAFLIGYRKRTPQEKKAALTANLAKADFVPGEVLFFSEDQVVSYTGNKETEKGDDSVEDNSVSYYQILIDGEMHWVHEDCLNVLEKIVRE